jgi:serine/threonine protein phosphatase PrpC
MDDDPDIGWRRVVSAPVATEPFTPDSSRTSVELAASSICGRLRADNTDHYVAIRLGRLQETLLTSLAASDLPPRFEEYAYAMIVADGLGDRGSGARASRVALSALAQLAIRYGKWNVRVDADTITDITAQGELLGFKTHDAVVSAAGAELRLGGMGTSLTAMYVAGSHLFFAHIGHSRAYLFREGRLIQLTTDHTIAEQEPGVRAAEEQSDFAHVVTEFIGGRTEPSLDIEHIGLVDGDRLLLCTNGLTDAVTPSEMAGVLALKRRPADDCQRLTELALSARAPDDVTVMVADYRLRADGGPRG